MAAMITTDSANANTTSNSENPSQNRCWVVLYRYAAPAGSENLRETTVVLSVMGVATILRRYNPEGRIPDPASTEPRTWKWDSMPNWESVRRLP